MEEAASRGQTQMGEINWIMELFDTAFSLLGKWGRWLNVKARRSCFIVWTICVLYWAVRDIQLGLYSQAIFCSFSVMLNIYGFFNWKRKDGD